MAILNSTVVNGQLTAELIEVSSSLLVGGDATVKGNLTIEGDLTYVGTKNLQVEDKVIEIAHGENVTPETADGAGVVIGTEESPVASIKFKYGAEGNSFVVSEKIEGNITDAEHADTAAKLDNALVAGNGIDFVNGELVEGSFDASKSGIEIRVNDEYIKELGVNANSASIAALEAKHNADKEELENKIASASSDSSEALNAYKEANDARVKAAEDAHSAYVESNDQAVADLTQTVANNKATASAELNTYKEANDARVAAAEASHSAYVESNNQAVADLTQTVADNKASASAALAAYQQTNDARVNSVESASNAAIAALDQKHADDKAALEASISNVAATASSNLDTAKSEINTRIDGVESANNTAHSEISGTIATLRDEFEQFKVETSGSEAGLAERVKANEDAIDLLNADNLTEGSVEYKVKVAVDGIISGSPAAFDTLKEISDWIAQDEQGTEALIGRVALLESTASTNAGTVADLTQTVVDNKAAAEKALSDYSASASTSQAAYSQSVANSFADASSSLGSVSSSLAQTIANNKSDIEGKLSDASSSLDSRITSVSESFAQTVADNKATASAELNAYKEVNDARVKAAEDAHSAYVEANDARVKAAEDAHSAYVESNDARVKAAEDALDAYKEANDARVATVENTYVTTASYNEYQTQVSQSFSTIENKIAEVESSASADYVKKAGDTMTGNLDMGSNSIVMGGVQIRYNATTQAIEFVFPDAQLV